MNHEQEEILKLKEEKNAIILAHNYQTQEIQEIADFLGDSLELCIKASQIEDADLVVFLRSGLHGRNCCYFKPLQEDIDPRSSGRVPHGAHAPCRRGKKIQKEISSSCSGVICEHSG